MIVNVKVLNGAEHSVEISPDQTVLGLKDILAKQISVPVGQQRLMLKGKPLADSINLKDCSLGADSKIHLAILKNATATSAATIATSKPQQETSTNRASQSAAATNNFIKQIKSLAEPYVIDVDVFAATFAKELKNMAYEMSLDDIERYCESRDPIAIAMSQSENVQIKNDPTVKPSD